MNYDFTTERVIHALNYFKWNFLQNLSVMSHRDLALTTKATNQQLTNMKFLLTNLTLEKRGVFLYAHRIAVTHWFRHLQVSHLSPFTFIGIKQISEF